MVKSVPSDVIIIRSQPAQGRHPSHEAYYLTHELVYIVTGNDQLTCISK